MIRIKATRFLLISLASYLGITLFFYFCGHIYLKALIPAAAQELRWLKPEYTEQKLSIIKNKGKYRLRFKAFVAVPIKGKNSKGEFIAFPKYSLQQTNEIDDIFVPNIIALALLAIWPVPWKNKKFPFILMMFILTAVNLIEIPSTFLFRSNVSFLSHELCLRLTDISTYYWVRFRPVGGRQFVAIVIFAISILPYYIQNTWPKKARDRQFSR